MFLQVQMVNVGQTVSDGATVRYNDSGTDYSASCNDVNGIQLDIFNANSVAEAKAGTVAGNLVYFDNSANGTNMTFEALLLLIRQVEHMLEIMPMYLR